MKFSNANSFKATIKNLAKKKGSLSQKISQIFEEYGANMLDVLGCYMYKLNNRVIMKPYRILSFLKNFL